VNGLRLVLLRLIAFLRASKGDAELAREIEAHLRMLEDDYATRGMNAEDARCAARRAFGGQVEQTKLRHRDTRSFRALDEGWLDIKLGARMLIRYPGLTVVGGIGMAVAIAISTASFAFFYAYIASTLPLDQGDRVVALENWDIEANNEERQALHDYVEWRDALGSMEDVGAFRTISRNLIVPGGAVEPVRLAEMSASGFRIARVPPRLGRPLLTEDERGDAPAVVVVGDDVWRSRFAADPAVIGRAIRLGSVVHTIVGVMPEGFEFPVNHSYWVPLRSDPARYRRGEGPALFIFGRLAHGATIEQAQAELTAIGQRNAARYPETHASLRPRVMPYAYPILDIQDVSLWQVGLMQAIVSVLLVVVAVNVAILVYARTATRQGEIAVRTAMGASRGRIIAQLFVEALVLSGLSAAAGLGLAKFGLHQAHLIMQMENTARPPYWIDFSVPWAAVAYVVGLALLAAAIAGVVPALQATGRRVHSTLQQLSGSSGLRLGSTWTLLIVAQVAFAVAALPIAAGLAWNEVRSTTTAPAFAVERYLAAQLSMDAEPSSEGESAAMRLEMRSRFTTVQRDLIARLESESWVSDVTAAERPPGQEESALIEVEGGSPADGAAARSASINYVDIDFFSAFDAQILAGRAFVADDRTVFAASPGDHPSPRAVVVNRAFADMLLGGKNPIGWRVRYAMTQDRGAAVQASRWYEVVGLVENLHTNPMSSEITAPVLYHPLTQSTAVTPSLTIRVSGGTPANYVGRLRELLAEVDPTVRLAAYPLMDIYRQASVARRLVAAATGLVTLSVLLLSGAGIYALMSFTISQRRKEIGIRAALGADARRILRSIFARATGQLALGVVVGISAALLIDWLGGGEMLGGAGALLLTAISALMLIAGLLASIGPARRGLRLEPTQALREA
jgi:predicted permease